MFKRKLNFLKKFKDFYKNEVTFSFEDHPFSKTPKHVIAICRYKDQWLLTEHKERGLEFPGGKVEKGENAKEAAIREIMEETGGIVKDLYYIGQYYVDGKSDYVIKNVYFANIEELAEQDHYYETKGPVLIEELPHDVKKNKAYSFIMKDGVLESSLEWIEQFHVQK